MADEVLRAKRRRKDGLPSILRNGRPPLKVKKQLRFAEGLNQIFEIPKVCNVNKVAIPVAAPPEESPPPSCKNSSPDNILQADGGEEMVADAVDVALYGQQFSSAVQSLWTPAPPASLPAPPASLPAPPTQLPAPPTQLCDLADALPQNLDEVEEELLLQSR